ncbi:MAG: hypothetical protein MUC55_13085 [Burkholderiales bacterium]|jgi:hypothetical protein|nr:hypothetical protein [Burkholderiales bacterium]
MSQEESREVSTGVGIGMVIAAVLAVVLAAAPKPDALQPIPVAQAAMPSSIETDGNGPTGYLPDRFRNAALEDGPQPEAF